jgi:hypothetical protein
MTRPQGQGDGIMAQPVLDFEVVMGRTCDELCGRVRDLLTDSYQPVGGVLIWPRSDGSFVLVIALVKLGPQGP